MPINDPLFWQGLGFSTANVLLVVLAIWWLYWSPTRGHVSQPEAPSPRLAAGLAALLGFSAIQLTAGALWDASMHILTGEIPAGADFLWPPHLMIYSSFLISLIVAMAAIGLVAVPAWRAGERDPRLWVRRNPYLGAVALASLYSLLAIPGDALWHALYGIDLTAWSPPHVMIIVSMCTVMICAVGVLVQVRPAGLKLNGVDYAIPVLLGLMLNVAFIVGTVEWELGVGQGSLLVRTNPIWVYPLVGGALACFTLALAKRLTSFRWAATTTAVTFFALRGVISIGLALTNNVIPYLPPLFIGGALLLDVVPWERIQSFWLRGLSMALAFTAGYALVALPMLAVRAHLPRFSSSDFVIAVATTLAVSLALVPIARFAGQRLAGERIQPS